MNLYRIEPLPTYEPMLKRHVQIIPETMYLAVSESRQYYSLLTPADLHNCQQGLFTICESDFPLYHKRTPSCTGALYFGKHDLAHEHCNKIILRKAFKPVWIHHKGTPSFWIYSLPMSVKVTKTCRVNGTMRGTDLDLKGAGILNVEENCQVFSENFLLLPTTNGYSNFTLTSGQVVIPELPDLLTEEETQVLAGHQSQADGTLDALDALMTRGLTAGQQHEISLRDLLSDVRRDQHEKRHYNWAVASVALILIILLVYLTSRYWRQSLPSLASWCVRWRNGTPAGVPAPRLRRARPSVLSMIDEECMMEAKPLGDPHKEVREERSPNPEMSMVPPVQLQVGATGETEGDRAATLPTPPGVRYSQPGRYQL